ncbi:NAD(P)/FAD-dependent oxidoreductase [Paenibacillus sp. 32O-W]|uniref:protoporphyrinogen/coproporphyrinogen oxidase n=1 Tax=Paenibacillus sp. 32O-W TaxID=1695218 RepID=UPI001642C480|nr:MULTISPECIES: FAD-dependent oxidoreductase [Paenibacillaceae]
MKRIVILGLGPCGIGAANKLQKIGYSNWVAFEKNSYAGGLATSFQDNMGFVWDIGGHVQFSHYEQYNEMLEEHFNSDLNKNIKRNAFAWQHDRFISYPYHANLKDLPADCAWECLEGLIDSKTKNESSQPPANFEEWIKQNYGVGIFKHFMYPYNYKVWAHEPKEMGYYWVKERVSQIDLKEVVRDILYDKTNDSWGPNNYFSYPIKGGTGTIWKGLAAKLPQSQIHFNKELTELNIKEKVLFFNDGSIEEYDTLITSIPLIKLIKMAKLEHLYEHANKLINNIVHVVGIGIKGEIPQHLVDKSWIYFPNDDTPCYRVTILSNYSKYNVPSEGHYSLLCEVSESDSKQVKDNLINEVIQGAINTKLMDPENGEVVSTWYFMAPFGYPVPTVERNNSLRIIQPELMKHDIYSRGRFGAWCYEISNQDHTFMQGMEVIEKVIFGTEEKTWRLF